MIVLAEFGETRAEEEAVACAVIGRVDLTFGLFDSRRIRSNKTMHKTQRTKEGETNGLKDVDGGLE